MISRNGEDAFRELKTKCWQCDGRGVLYYPPPDDKTDCCDICHGTGWKPKKKEKDYSFIGKADGFISFVRRQRSSKETQGREEKKKYDCLICKIKIVKYGLDLGDTVSLEHGYICDECGYEIAKQRISR